MKTRIRSLSNGPCGSAGLTLKKTNNKDVKELPGKVYLFFDEVQEVKHWERAINSFRTDLNCDLRLRPSALPR